MKLPYLLILAIWILAFAPETASTQSPATDSGAPSTKSTGRLTGGVESLGERLYLHLTNDHLADDHLTGDHSTGVFRGSAEIRLDRSAAPPAAFRLEVELVPGESRLFPIKLSAGPGEHYTLAVFNGGGALILYQDAPIKQTTGLSPPAPDQLVKLPASDEIMVRARFSRAELTAEVMAESPDAPRPLILIIDLTAAAPINDAVLAVKIRYFEGSSRVTINNHAQANFELPEELKESTLQYTLTDASGRLRASGEIDLQPLMRGDSVILSGFTFDKSDYAPGDTARISIQLQGQTPHGYRIDVSVKEGNTVLCKDARQDTIQSNQARQEFVINLPSEPKDPVVIEYTIFGVQTGQILHSGIREIVISKQGAKGDSDSGSRLPP